eukprot:29352-Rhodomonas_salina.1
MKRSAQGVYSSQAMASAPVSHSASTSMSPRAASQRTFEKSSARNGWYPSPLSFAPPDARLGLLGSEEASGREAE